MGNARPKRFWRRLRIGFRALRYFIWLLLIAVLLFVLYLNRVGLPDFLKRPLLEELHGRGVDLQFRRLRLHFDHGLVAEDVRLRRPNPQAGPEVTLQSVQLGLDWDALLKRKVQVTGLLLNEGRIVWVLAESNRTPRILTVDHIRTALNFHTNDVWELSNFEADFPGARLRLNGTITNASAFQDWRGPASTSGAEAVQRLQQRLSALADLLEQIKLPAPPELRIGVSGDVRDWMHWTVHFDAILAGAETPWGSFTNGLVQAHLLPADTNGQRHAELALEAGAARTRWAEAQALRLKLNLEDVAQSSNLLTAALDLRAGSVKTEWGETGPFQFTARWQHALTDYLPVSGEGELHAADLTTRWGEVARATIKGRLEDVTPVPARVADESWGPWRFFEPYAFTAQVELDRFAIPKLVAEHAAFSCNWRAPVFELSRFQARLYDGGAQGSGTVNVTNRQALAQLTSDLDIQQITPWLTTNGVRWIRQFTWEKPPRTQGQLSLIFPAWTNRAPNWRGEVLPTLQLSGEFQVGRGTFRGVSAESGSSHVTYSNMVWYLPDLIATRPEGRLELLHIADDRTREYYFKFHSTIDPQALRQLLKPEQQRGFELVTFTQFPLVAGEVWGVWRHPELIGVSGTVAVSNFTFRGETGSVLRAGVQYSNRVLTVISPEVWQDGRFARAEGLQVDFPADCLYLTNGTSNMDPMIIARAISAKTARAFEPYRFLNPPESAAHGTIPLHITNNALADLAVELNGGPFEWWKIKMPQISGAVRWRGDTLSLSNVQADFYGGTAAGNADFDMHSSDGTRMRFDLTTSNANLRAFLADVNPGHTNIEGIVAGQVFITDAVGTNWQTWNGYGHVTMRDGLLWDWPLFGILSEALSRMGMPGLGSSRASEARATFTLTNGVAYSEDLQVHATYMRLFMRGSISLQSRVDVRAEASLFRDSWIPGRIIGLVLSPVTKIFEYHVTGTLAEPKKEPLYFPMRVILMPFHPFRTLKDFFTPDEGVPNPEARFPSEQTAPPAKEPPEK